MTDEVALRDGETRDDSHAARNAALLASLRAEHDGHDDDGERPDEAGAEDPPPPDRTPESERIAQRERDKRAGGRARDRRLGL